jgi:hypothetical protein
MADAAAAVTDAPKQIMQFGERHLLAFLLLVVLLAVLFVRYDVKNPGVIRKKVQGIPGVGPWATGIPNP